MSRKPVAVARFDERPRIGVMPDGELWGMFTRWGVSGQELARRRSRDGGKTWSGVEKLLVLDAEPGRWAGCEVVVDHQGEVHAFLVNDRHTGVFLDPDGGREVGPLPIAERRIDVWHTRTDGGRCRWRQPGRIWKGYTGSINSAIQTKAGRIIVAFAFQTSRSWGDRGEGLDEFWYVGQSSSTVIYSDDGGDSWTLSPSALKVQTPSIGPYGACEPVVMEKTNGSVWMLMRTQTGRFYESHSADGAIWSHPRPTGLINSDSPAGLVRLPDGRMILLWNKCMRFPYAHGGRHVLHGAISADDGETWSGHREVARDPRRAEPPPPRGDHGTAYPYPAVLADGTVLVTTGQGEGRVSIVSIDPGWLSETTASSDFRTGGADLALEEWSTFGCRGVELVDHPDEAGLVALRVARREAGWPAAAVWNFPLGRVGRLSAKIRINEAFGGALLLLSDHYSVPFDPEDALFAMFALQLEADETAASSLATKEGTTGARALGPRVLPAGIARCLLSCGDWHDLELTWDCDDGTAELRVDGEVAGNLGQLRQADGVCYLRLKSTAEVPDGGFDTVAVEAVVTGSQPGPS